VIGNDKKYSSSILIGTLSAATITLVLLMILRYVHAFSSPLRMIEKISALSVNHPAFFAYAISILITLIIFTVGCGVAYAARRQSRALPQVSP
jgi:hypothetical protein